MSDGRKVFAAAVKAPARPKPAPVPAARAASPVPAPAPAADVAGNQQMLRAHGPRPAVAVSAPTDPEEREADLAADAFVARAPLPVGFGARGVVADIRRKCSACEEPVLFRKAEGTAGGATVHALRASRGEPLAPSVRRPYEGFFGADLSAMRIHTGGTADAAARSISATAFARGDDVYFQDGRFDPATAEGERLLAHETAHVVQHARASGGEAVHRQPEEGGVLDSALALGRGLVSSVTETASEVAGSVRDAAAGLLERLAPGALAFFRGIRATIEQRVSEGFDGLFGGLAGRIRSEGFAGALSSILGELAGGAAKGIGELIAGNCAALGAGAELLLQLGIQLGRDKIESLRQDAAAIGAVFNALWDAYGKPAASALGTFAADIWKGITAQVAEWWEALAPVREVAGELWDSVVEIVTQGYADLQSFQTELFQMAVQEWERIRLEILPFMGYVKAVGVILLLLSPMGPFVVVGAAAYALYELVAYVWQTWGGPLTAQIRADLANKVLPAIMEQLHALQGGIAQAKAWFGKLAGELAAQAAALLQASGALPYLRLARALVGQLAAQLQEFAASVGVLVDEFTKAAGEFLRAAMEYLRPIAEFLRQSILVLVFGPFAILDDGVWDSVKTLAQLALGVPCLRELAEFMRLPAILEQGESFRRIVKAAWTLMQNPEPIWNALHEALTPMVAAVPGIAATAMAGVLLPTEPRHRQGVERYLQPAIDHFMAHWWEELKRLGWTLIWPFDEIGTQLPLLIERGSNAIGAVFNLEIGRAIDEFLAMLQSANAILGALWGWFAIASVLIGGMLGALGVEFTAGSSIAIGASAGWALAETVGLVLLVAMAATEGAIIERSLFDLRYSNVIIANAVEQEAANESDYKAIAGSTFSIAVLTGLLILGALAQKIASAVWSLVADIVPGRAAVSEFLNRPRGRAPAEPPVTGEPGVTGDTGTTPPVDEPAIVEEPAVVKEPAVVEEPVVAEEPAAVEEPAPADEAAPPPEEATGEPVAEESPAMADVNERLAQLEQQVFEQTREVNRLRERVRSEPRGSDARAAALDEFNAAKERLEGLTEERDGTLLERSELRAREEAAAAARTGRLPEDIAAEQASEAPPEASDSPATVGDSPTQNADVARWVERLREMGATDIRVDQIQVNGEGRVVGRNRPDLQFTLNGERYYVEWDRPSSGRGPDHAARIRANDPSAVTVRGMTVDPGYPFPAIVDRIILIIME
jgi:Domain of unknown function (DUF4157)